MICAAALPPRTPYSHTTSKVLSAASVSFAAAASAFAAAADFSDGNLGPDFSAAGSDNNNNNNNNNNY